MAAKKDKNFIEHFSFTRHFKKPKKYLFFVENNVDIVHLKLKIKRLQNSKKRISFFISITKCLPA